MSNPDNCALRISFQRYIATHNLSVLYSNIMSEISRNFRLTPVSPYQLADLFVYKQTNGGFSRKLLTPNDKIIELTYGEFRRNWPDSSSGVLGGHSNGRIFLRTDRWCYKTLIHEILHSLSNYSLTNLPVLEEFREGLTDFLTGYLLWNTCPECHIAWKNRTYSYCKISQPREPWIKLFGAFRHYLPLSLLVDLYFHNGLSWETNYDTFLTQIRNDYPRFRDIFTIKKKIPLYLHFLQECSKNFGKRDFDSTFTSRDKCLDFP